MGSRIAVAVLLLASFMSRDEAIPVRAATVERSTIRSVISTNGKVEPLQSFEAHAPVGTTVKKLLVKEGDRVKKGQLLAQLDDADARSQAARALAQVRASQAEVSAMERGGNREEVLTLEAQLVKSRSQRDTAQRNLEALKRLQQQGAASPGEVNQAEDQLAGAEADLKLVQQKQKERYSQPEIAHVEAQQAEARLCGGGRQSSSTECPRTLRWSCLFPSRAPGRVCESRRPGIARGRSLESSGARLRG